MLCALRDSFSVVSRSEVTGTLGEGFCLFQNFWFFTNFESCFMCSFAIFTYYFTLFVAGWWSTMGWSRDRLEVDTVWFL